MIEVQFQVQGETLRGHLHCPETVADTRRPGILILPGFADTAVGPHNLHRAMAEALSKAGAVVLRFDYRGQGESDGSFRNFTAQSGLEDALAALQVLAQRQEVDTDRLGIVGFSLGGALACVLAAQHTQIRRIVLLAPVAYPFPVFKSFFTAQQLEQATQQSWIDWLGWEVGAAYLPSLEKLEPLNALKASQANALVIHGTADSEVLPVNAEAYAAQGAHVYWLEGGDHQFSSIRWQEQSIEQACTFFSVFRE